MMSRRIVVVVASVAVIAGCSTLSRNAGTSARPSTTLSNSEKVAHVLSRLTFGARPGDADRVAAIGVDQWIDQQLHPERIDDNVLVVALAPIPEWSNPAQATISEQQLRQYAYVPMAKLMADTAARMALKNAYPVLTGAHLYAGKIIHAQTSERQLLEVMVDFWENRFSVYNGKMPSADALLMFDRDVIRPHALGKFRDLLGAVAHSPAMLFYLDNYLSKNGALNENYARELLELHTLGVDGGYTQHDVIEVARAFTGWRISQSQSPSQFVFRKELHDTGTKTVLGHTLRAGRGIEDGEEVLDIIARHPSTAHHIAFALARRLVSDDPPPALVDRAAETFMRTDGDIAQVTRTIVTSREFFSRAAFRAKVKSPFELVLSELRAIDAPADTTMQTSQLIARLGQPTFGWPTPEGWPENSSVWMNAGTIYQRMRFATNVAAATGSSANLTKWRDWATLSSQTIDAQVDGVIKDFLGGIAAPATRAAMLAPDPGATDGPQRLRSIVAIAMASPDFQRR
jgi:uncharacterized protein (DUF1800 family)